MVATTYSFGDIKFTFSHQAVGVKTLNGEGIGQITVAYSTDNTSHELAADGTVMVTKVKADNGHVSIQIQQSSSLHAWLRNYFNYINLAAADQWAAGIITIHSNLNIADNILASFVAPVKRPDQPYHQQGQLVTWNFMAARIDMI